MPRQSGVEFLLRRKDHRGWYSKLLLQQLVYYRPTLFCILYSVFCTVYYLTSSVISIRYIYNIDIKSLWMGVLISTKSNNLNVTVQFILYYVFRISYSVFRILYFVLILYIFHVSRHLSSRYCNCTCNINLKSWSLSILTELNSNDLHVTELLYSVFCILYFILWGGSYLRALWGIKPQPVNFVGGNLMFVSYSYWWVRRDL